MCLLDRRRRRLIGLLTAGPRNERIGLLADRPGSRMVALLTVARRDLVRLLDDVEGLERRLAGVCHVDGCIDAWNQIVETLTGRDPS